MNGEGAARPFLKWAGGKGQLLEAICARLPEGLACGKIRRYVEPFAGSGAVFFRLSQDFRPPEVVLMDANEELVLTWRVVRDAVEPLIVRLGALTNGYLAEGLAGQERLFLSMREAFNAARPQYDFECSADRGVERAAQMIFLNRTCFNGLFRVNSRALFNVPFGKYKSPRICDCDGLRRASAVLQGVRIEQGDFSRSSEWTDESTFIYLDPPYRPISRTASFNSYAAEAFGDEEQRRLAAFFREMDGRGARLLLSNSDPKNENPEDDFFDRLYEGFVVERVPARRSINSDGGKRGVISELLVRNY